MIIGENARPRTSTSTDEGEEAHERPAIHSRGVDRLSPQRLIVLEQALELIREYEPARSTEGSAVAQGGAARARGHQIEPALDGFSRSRAGAEPRPGVGHGIIPP